MLNLISKPVRTGLPIGLPCLFVLWPNVDDSPPIVGGGGGGGGRRWRSWRGRRRWKRAGDVDRDGRRLENDGGRIELVAVVGLVNRQVGELSDPYDANSVVVPPRTPLSGFMEMATVTVPLKLV